MTFDFHDTRSGNTYTVSLDAGEFLHALRYTGTIGTNPIEYDTLREIPEPHRTEIQNQIEWMKRR